MTCACAVKCSQSSHVLSKYSITFKVWNNSAFRCCHTLMNNLERNATLQNENQFLFNYAKAILLRIVIDAITFFGILSACSLLFLILSQKRWKDKIPLVLLY
jgi:hypothetical protein